MSFFVFLSIGSLGFLFPFGRSFLRILYSTPLKARDVTSSFSQAKTVYSPEQNFTFEEVVKPLH